MEVVKVRANAMQKATEEADSGMMTVFLNADHKLNFAMLTARKYCSVRLGIEDPVCQVANYFYTECKVIAGHNEVRFELSNYYSSSFQEQPARLNISRFSGMGPFHLKY